MVSLEFASLVQNHINTATLCQSQTVCYTNLYNNKQVCGNIPVAH